MIKSSRIRERKMYMFFLSLFENTIKGHRVTLVLHLEQKTTTTNYANLSVYIKKKQHTPTYPIRFYQIAFSSSIFVAFES